MARDADATRRRILSVALELFRERGFDKTTMRRVAEEAGLSLGAAYHHFASKQDIARAYYAQQTKAHETASRAAWEGSEGWLEKVGLVLHTGLDVRAMDRALMRELAPLVVGSDEKTSAFSAESAELRQRSIGLYREAVDDPAVPEDFREVLASALWALSMGILLYYAHDDSPEQRKTRALVDGAVELTGGVVAALGLPMMKPFRVRLHVVLRNASLLF